MQPLHSVIYPKQYTQITLRPPSLNSTRYTQQMRFQPALKKTFSTSCHQTPAGNQSTPNHGNKIVFRLFFFNKRFTISNTEKQVNLPLQGNDPRPLVLNSDILTPSPLSSNNRHYSKRLYTQNPIPVLIPCCYSTSLK